jgi:hypothetical protein
MPSSKVMKQLIQIKAENYANSGLAVALHSLGMSEERMIELLPQAAGIAREFSNIPGLSDAELDALQAQVDGLERFQSQAAAEPVPLRPAILDRAFKGGLGSMPWP